MRSRLLTVCFAAVLTGCVVGPNYKRPAVPAPPQFRADQTQPSQGSLGDMKWFDLFQDETLRDLIREALEANHDIRIAAQRVLEAQGRLTATRSALAPQAGVQADVNRFGVTSPIQTSGRGFEFASWEIDLFGKVRRAAEASRAEFFAAGRLRRAAP